MKKICKYISDKLSLIISIIAVLISFFTYQTSKQSYEYILNKDMMINTPAIKENLDSLNISFFLNNNNAELHNLSITFPSTISNQALIINTKPINVNRYYLETLIENYLHKSIEVKDSVLFIGITAIPVMIDYSAIVYGFPQRLRENRLFVFEIHSNGRIIKAKFSNSILNGRYGYPLKNHTFFLGFFSSLDEKIRIQDNKDVQELLKVQLEEIKKNHN